MNVPVNPTPYAAQHSYGFNNRDPNVPFPLELHPQSQSQAPFPPRSDSQRPPNTPAPVAPTHQQFNPPFAQSHPGYALPPRTGDGGLTHAPLSSQVSTSHPQLVAAKATAGPLVPLEAPAHTQGINGNTAGRVFSTSVNMMQQRPQAQSPMPAQQLLTQNTVQNPRAVQQLAAPLSPQSAARERARVSVLLDINTHLLQEVVSLQTQGKAGSAPTQNQQSPISPTSATDAAAALNNSPTDPSKPAQSRPPSQEYAECMRRLQANLSYLAAIADPKKKMSGTVPAGPAIMAPPPHLTGVHELYKKLNALFPEASQPGVNRALAVVNSQAGKPAQTTPS